MTITATAPTRTTPQTFTASEADTLSILKALATRQQLASDELRRAAGMAGDLGFGGRMVDLSNRGLVERWTTKKGERRSMYYGPGWQITQDGRKWLAGKLLAAADVTPSGQKPDSHHAAKEVPPEPQPAQIAHLSEKPAADPALAVLKAIAAQPHGALDADVAQRVHSPNDRERAYAELRVKGLIRYLPMPLVPRMFAVTAAGRAHLAALESCRALMIRPPMALMIVPSSTGA